ncbi:MAG: zinc metalloprotease [Gaiellaceae bacterium]
MSGFTLRRSRGKFLGVFAVAAALVLSFAVSPAAAGTSQTASWTDTCDGQANGFSSLDQLTESSTARGGVVREPALSQTATEIGPRKGRGARFGAKVPTYVHVVHHANGTGNVSNKAIRDQMQVLNMTFGGFEGGVATGFSFDLAGITRTANTEWYLAGPTTSGERAMKQALRQGGDNALNMYLTTAGVYLGWAYFPNVLENATRYLDGIVVDWESMVGTSTRYAGQYDLGKTVPHEVGHWLNLHHVFNGGCNNFGDYVEDTPPQRIATFGCPEGQDSCREPGLDSIHNYMDYSFDSCYNQFTAGQALRMQDAWLEWRAS